MRFSNRVVLSVIIIVVVMAVIGSLMKWRERGKIVEIDSFEKCASAGYPVGESYPAQCWTLDGRNFREEVLPSSPITVVGEIVCLPHREIEGAQTMECVFGFRDEGGNYYSVSFVNSEYEVLKSESSMGRKIELKGMLRQGVIEVSSVRPL